MRTLRSRATTPPCFCSCSVAIGWILPAAARDASLLLMRSTPAGPSEGPPDLRSLGQAVGNWSIVHGFALLLIDGRLDQALTLPACGGDVDVLLDAALAA
jgi:hypothetical protein